MEPVKSTKERTLRESKSALLEAAQAAIADQKERAIAADWGAPERGASRGTIAFRTFMGLLIMLGTGALVLRPAWIFGERLPTETVAVKAASATLALVEAASHVKAFTQATGRFPARLSDAGVLNRAITLKPLEAGEFQVSMAAGDSVISLRSTDSLKSIVVSAILTLQRRT